MKMLIIYFFLLVFSSCNSQTRNLNLARYFLRNISIDMLIGKQRKPIRYAFFKDKALVFSISTDLKKNDNGILTFIDLKLRKKILDIPNNIFNYQNLVISMNDSGFYFTEHGSKLLYAYNYLQKKVEVIDISQASNSVIYGEIIGSDDNLYFLRSPYGATIISTKNIVKKPICSNGIMNSNYAIVSTPISDQENLITGCLNSKSDSIEIIALDSKFQSRWKKFIKYDNGSVNQFQMFNVGNIFMLLNSKELTALDKSGNVIWSKISQDKIIKSVVKDSSIFSLSQDETNSFVLSLRKIDLKTGITNDSINLNFKSFNSNIIQLSVSNKGVIIQNESAVFVVKFANFKNYSKYMLKDRQSIQTVEDKSTMSTYTILDNVIYW